MGKADPGPYSPKGGKTVNQVHSGAGTIGKDNGNVRNNEVRASLSGKGSKGGK